MLKPTIEEMPDGSIYATIPALWEKDGGSLEPGSLTLERVGGSWTYAATGDRIQTEPLGTTLQGWGQHDGPAYYVTADGCAWSCRVNRATWSLLP